MPTYRLHLENGSTVHADEEGQQFADDAGALAEASSAASDVMRDELRAGGSPVRIVVTVATTDGREVGTVRADATIERASGPS